MSEELVELASGTLGCFAGGVRGRCDPGSETGMRSRGWAQGRLWLFPSLGQLRKTVLHVLEG